MKPTPYTDCLQKAQREFQYNVPTQLFTHAISSLDVDKHVDGTYQEKRHTK